MSFNLATILREPRREHPDKPLCHINDLTFTYAQVDGVRAGMLKCAIDEPGRRSPSTPARGPGPGWR